MFWSNAIKYFKLLHTMIVSVRVILSWRLVDYFTSTFEKVELIQMLTLKWETSRMWQTRSEYFDFTA